MTQSPEDRIDQLERLVSSLRHDLRGIVTPAALVADGLMRNTDPAVRRTALRISDMVERIVSRLNATNQIVPPRAPSGPLIGGNHRNSAAPAISSGRRPLSGRATIDADHAD
jgi:hypothetical protein